MIKVYEAVLLIGQILEKYKQAMAYQIYQLSGNINEDIEHLEQEIQKDRFELMCLLGIGKRPPKGESISIKITNKP